MRNAGSCHRPRRIPAGWFALAYLFPGKHGEPVPSERFKALELEQRVPGLALKRRKIHPADAGFDQIGAVSYTKGCYPGQEIVARTRYLGKVKRNP